MTVPTLEDLLAALTADGSVQKVAHDTVLVHEYLGRRFDPPVPLTVNEDSLQRLLRSMAPSAPEVFPDVDALTGAFRLLLVHLESILSIDGQPSSVVIDAPAVKAPRPPTKPSSIPDAIDPHEGEYAWSPYRLDDPDA